MHYTVEKRADRDSYRVTWYDPLRRSKSFATRIAADTWAADMNRLARMEASPAEIVAAKREAAGTGYPIDVLVRAGLEAMRASGASRADVALSFAEASEQMMAAATKTGARPSTLASYERVYAILNRTWGSRAAATISQAEVEDYLSKLAGRDGRPGTASLATKANHLGHIRMAMRVAGVPEPLARIILPRDERDVEYFSVSECRRILAACPRKDRGFLAVALFAGVRPENLALMPASCVSVLDKRIRIPAEIAKDRQTHLLEADVLPPVLWKWLKLYPYEPTDNLLLARRLKKALGRWVKGGLRHTAATYYCALHGVTATARLLTHQGERLVRKHYAGVVESVQAQEFYALGPGSIKFAPVETRGKAWPDDETLERMLAAEPAVAVAKKLHVSDAAITKRCRARGIRKPGRGAWTPACDDGSSRPAARRR